MKQCAFFGRCGGCKYDFSDADYRAKKSDELKQICPADNAVWIAPGGRRRGDFCFAAGKFGLFARGTKDIVPVARCENMVDAINDILPRLAQLPWAGAGSCMVTACDNGIDIAITSNVGHFTSAFKDAVEKTGAIRATWNGRVVFQNVVPVINFDGKTVEYPPYAFLQPSVAGADALRDMVVAAAAGAKKVADLFCGLGNFTYALDADGFDVFGTGICRDLFTRPLTLGMLRQYDCVVMDPPRAGAMAQCRVLAKSDVKKIIYVSCNPQTFRRDAKILTDGGYKMVQIVPVDQFAGSGHWEIFSVFQK